MILRLKRVFTLILILTVTLSTATRTSAAEASEEKWFSVTGDVIQKSKDSITLLSKEKERTFSIKGAEIRYTGEILKGDCVKVIYSSKDRSNAVEIRMVKASKSHSVIYLTFDDGPDNKNTTSIIKTLLKHQAGGTFFFTGKNMSANREAVKAVHDNGFTIGLHGYTHIAFTKMSEAVLKTELNKSNELLYDITGKYSYLTRPPYGRTSTSVDRTLESMGQKKCMWTIDTRDWEKKEASAVLNYIMRCKLRPGDIVLMHSGYGQSRSAQALPQIIEYVRSQGLEPVNIPENKRNQQ